MTYQTEVLADSPLAYWRLNESSGTLADSSGNGKTLTPANSPTLGAAGPFAGEASILLDGTSQRLNSNQGINNSDYSIEFWYKGTDTAGALASARGAGSKSITVFLGAVPVTGSPAGSVGIGIDADATWRGAYTTTATIHDGTWHHVVGVWDGTSGTPVEPAQFTIYIDGVAASLASSSYNTSNAPVSSGTLGYSFGGRFDGGEYVSGQLSNIALYATPLPSARVAAHYAAAMATSGPASLTLSGTLPAIQSSLTLSSYTDTATDNRANGRIRNGGFVDESEEPVEPMPANLVRAQRVVKAIAYPTPTLVDGRPT